MGEWMPATVYVSVPDHADIDTWLHRTTDRHGYERAVLAAPDDVVAPPPIGDLLATADRRVRVGMGAGSVPAVRRHWRPGGQLRPRRVVQRPRRRPARGRLGLPLREQRAPRRVLGVDARLARRTSLRAVRRVQGLDAAGLRAALDEANAAGIDAGEHLDALLQPWPGWTAH